MGDLVYIYGGGHALPDDLKLIVMGILAIAIVIFLMRKTSKLRLPQLAASLSYQNTVGMSPIGP
jgi:hypothetical protein